MTKSANYATIGPWKGGGGGGLGPDPKSEKMSRAQGDRSVTFRMY